MGNRLSYYFSQGVKNLKGSILIILGLSLAISMVSGISMYIDAYQDNLMNESFDQIIDFDARFQNSQINFSGFFQDSDDAIISTVQDSEILQMESFSRYSLFESSDLNFYKNYSTIPQEDREGREKLESYDFLSGLFDEDFYVSKRFDQYFHIIEGEYPRSENEILIPINFAYQMNLTLGEVVDLDVFHDYINYETNISSNFFLPSMEVIGIYASKMEFYRFGNNYFRPRYVFDEETNTAKDLEHFGEPEMIFCYNNFSKLENNHPIQYFFTDIDQFFVDNFGEDIEFRYKANSGIMFFYNRDLIDFNHINSYSRRIYQEIQIIERQLDIYISDYLSNHLSDLYSYSNVLRIGLQFLNIPILIFAIFIGSFAIKSNAKTRLDEFLLLRSKGAPPKLLKNQFLIESLFIGLVSSVIALIAGLGTFIGFRELLGELFFNTYSFTTPSTVPLSPNISWDTVFLTMGFGVGITFIATFSSISYVRKLSTDKLLKILGSDSMDVEYDEKSLFSDPKTKKISIEETPFYYSSQEKDDQISQSKGLKEKKEESSKGLLSKLKRKFTIQRQKKKDLYQNIIQVKERKGSKLSIAFIIVSLFPLILYFITFLGTLPAASDLLIRISDTLVEYFGVILVAAIISPILLVVGIIRIIIVEKPSRFARLSKLVSSIFLKDRSYICGMEMVRRKQYKTAIFLVGTFSSLLIFSNVFLNSFYRYNIIFENWITGSDIKVTTNLENINNTADIDLLESQLKAYQTLNNETLINDVLTCYRELDKGSLNPQSLTYFNFEKYLRLIQENGKILPNKAFISQIQEVIDYNKNSSNTIPGVIVNTGFLQLNQINVGDLYSITHVYYNSVTLEMENQTIEVKIILDINIMPGIYFSSSEWGSDIMAMDINSFNQDKTLLHGFFLFQLMDINPALETDLEVLETMLQNASSGYVDYSRFNFYDQNWNSLSYEMNNIESSLYGIFYLEFIIIGILLAFGLSILILALQKENKYFNGVLLARGLGRSGLLKIVLSQIFIIFLIGIFTGIFSGLFTSISLVKIFSSTIFWGNIVSLPIYSNILELFGMLGIIVISSFAIYLISYYFESRNTITEYFHKF